MDWSTITRMRLVLFIIAALAVCRSDLTRALNPEEGLSEYKHSVWRNGDQGLSGQGSSVAQSADGYLWVGTSAGLFRFDGVRFQEEDGDTNDDVSLYRSSDGSVWISGTSKGLTRVKDEKLETIDPGARVGISVTEDERGTVWYVRYNQQAGTGELCSWGPGVGARCLPSPYRFSAERTICSFADAIWIGSDEGLIRFRDGRFTNLPIPGLASYANQEGVQALLPDGRAGLLVAVANGPIGRERVTDNRLTPLEGLRGLDPTLLDVASLFRDREGALWIGTLSHGIYRIYHDRVDHYASAPDSSRKVLQFAEDHEGSIWFVSADGLERFSDRKVVTLANAGNFYSAGVRGVSVAHDGTLWITGRETLLTLAPGSHTFSAPAIISQQGHTTSMFEDHAGVIWVGFFRSLTRLEGHRLLPLKPSTGAPPGLIASLTEDRAFNLWAVSLGPPRQILKIDPDRLRVTPVPNLPPASRVVADPAGGVYVAALNGDLVHVDPLGRQVIYPHPSGHSARIPQLSVAGDGTVYASTSFGLETLRKGEIQVLDTRNGLPCDVLYDSIFDRYENLWLYSRCGVVRIAKQDLARWQRDPAAVIPTQVLDAEDGAAPFDAAFGGSARTPDGVLWFSNNEKLQKIDPDLVARSGTPPPVHIEQFTADGKHYDTDKPIRLPPLAGDIQIDYTGLSFVAPGKVQFRYKLDGFDRNWTDAGPRRQAFYTTLPPGNYRFHVIASNNNGVWNDVGASLGFQLAPAFYQTVWFKLLCGIVTLMLLWLILQVRVRQVAGKVRLRQSIQYTERLRIARDLHDTLLQSFQGLLLRFQTVHELLPQRPVDAKETLASAIDRTAQAITEGREAVQRLRGSTVESNDLAMAITNLGEELAAEAGVETSIALRVQVEGAARILRPTVRDEIYRIAGEALRNAFRHAGAEQIEVEIRYDDQQLRVRVRDDGKGIDPKFLTAEGPAGHFGLRGMRERAGGVGGKLTVWSAAGSGTEIEFAIPAARAYAESAAPRRAWFGEEPVEKGSQSAS